MGYWTLILSFALCVSSVFAQDERLFRELLTGEAAKDQNKVEKVNYKILARSPRYQIDITEDHRPESFYTAKQDGEDWIFLLDHKGNSVYQFRFDPVGPYSRIYKANLRRISKKTKVLILYFYEGATKFFEFRGTARAYFLTIDNNDLNTLAMYKGPLLFDEQKGFKDHYHQRKYELSMIDLDGDGKREIAARYYLITRVYKYLEDGKWYKYKKKIED